MSDSGRDPRPDPPPDPPATLDEVRAFVAHRLAINEQCEKAMRGAKNGMGDLFNGSCLAWREMLEYLMTGRKP